MKKNILTKFGGLFLGLTMGLGVAVGVTVGNNKASEVRAAVNEEHAFAQSASTLLNNGAAITPIEIKNLSYPIKEVKVTVNYNKTAGGVTTSVTVGGAAFGSAQKVNSSTTTTLSFKQADNTTLSGDVVISFQNHCTKSSGCGTWKVSNVVLVEGESEKEVTAITSMSGKVVGIQGSSSWDYSNVVVTGNVTGSTDVDITNQVNFSTTAVVPSTVSTGTLSLTATAKKGSATPLTSTMPYEVIAPKGSRHNPFTVAEVKAYIDEHSTGSNIYVKGYVTSVDSFSQQYGSITYWLDDTIGSTKAFEVYGGLNLNGEQFSDISGISTGIFVVVGGDVKKYSSTYEFDKNSIIYERSDDKTVTSIAIKTAQSKTVYGVGDAFDPAGLVLTVTYDKGTPEDIAYSATSGITFSAINDQGKVTITYKGQTVIQTVTLVNDWAFKSITLSAGTGKTTYSKGSEFDKTGYSVSYVEHSEIAGVDRTTEVAETATFNGFDSSTVKTCNVTATYGGHTSNSIEISIVDVISYPKLTDASLIKAGMVVRMANSDKKLAAGAWTSGSNPYLAAEKSVEFDENSGDMLSENIGYNITIGGSEGAWTLTTSEGQIGATANKKVGLDSGTLTWSISISDGDATISTTAASDESVRFLCNANGGSERFAIYNDSTSTSATMVLPQLYVVSMPTAPTAETFATKFINDTNSICANTGNNRDALAAIWDGFGEEFNKLSSTEQGILKNASADATGSVIENAMARYDHIVLKYGLTDFIDGRPVVAARVPGYINNQNDNTATIIIAVVSVLSLATLCTLIVIKRRKSIEK